MEDSNRTLAQFISASECASNFSSHALPTCRSRSNFWRLGLSWVVENMDQ